VPTQNGIVLSLERMDAVEIDRENMMAVVEAGATLGKLIENAENSGFAFPPHPGDEGAQIGGLIACNAGGARALKHGVMRNFVKGLEVVLANGEVLRLGGKLLKDNMGYSIMHLMIGSEGTLGVITKAILRLMPKFESTLTMVTPYSSRHEALSAVPKVLWRGILPMALEYVERDLMERSAEHLGEKWFVEGDVFLIFILAGREDDIYSEAEAISDVCRESGSSEPLVAERRDEQSTILKIRSNIYTALKKDTIDILDTTVPPSNIGKLADAIDAVATRYNTRLPLYGHAGDGNLHCHIMRNDLRNYSDMKRSIYDSTIALGGVITGEHGVGKLRVFELQRILPPQHIILMKELKRVFDPNNILNPSAVLS
jgi:glycolate oxidase